MLTKYLKVSKYANYVLLYKLILNIFKKIQLNTKLIFQIIQHCEIDS